MRFTQTCDVWKFAMFKNFAISQLFLGTTDNQFGFNAGHSTDQCTFC